MWEGFRDNWIAILFLPFVTIVVGILLGLYRDGWWSGFFAGVFVAVGVAAPVNLMMMVTGSAPRSMGASAEQEASEAIRRGAGKRARAFDRVAFKGWDVDHLVVTPTRALVIETKWSADPWDLTDVRDDRLREAVRQVSSSLRSVRIFLGSTQIRLPLDVQPLVVVDGRQKGDLHKAGSIDGCPVVHVRGLRSWIESWCGESGKTVLDAPTFDAGCENIAAFLGTRDEYDARRTTDHFFVLHGVFAPMQTAWEAMLAFGAGVLLMTAVFGALHASTWIRLAAMGLTFAGGALAIRRARRRAALLGWVAGGLFLVAFIVVAVAAALW